MVEVSVIIVNFNGEKFIGSCVESVLASDFKDFEVVVVDNASTDGSVREIQNSKFKSQKYKSKVKIIRSKKQLYFTGGCNLGAKYARGEKIIFLNSDCIVTPNWIKELVGKNKKWIVQPKILRQDDKVIRNSEQSPIIDNAGTGYNFLGIARGRGYLEKDSGQYDKNEEVEICAGTCFMIDRDFFWKLGGFDEGFRYQYEDVDLCLRAKRAGGKCFLCYKSVIYHKGSATFKENVSGRELLFNIRKNRILTAEKNFGGVEKAVRLFLVRMINFFSVLKEI